jgi:hypothetical protein
MNVRCRFCAPCKGHDVFDFLDEPSNAADQVELIEHLIAAVKDHERFHDVESEGYVARDEDDKSQADNPYPKGCEDHRAWDRGYLDADLRTRYYERGAEIESLRSSVLAFQETVHGLRQTLMTVRFALDSALGKTFP